MTILEDIKEYFNAKAKHEGAMPAKKAMNSKDKMKANKDKDKDEEKYEEKDEDPSHAGYKYEDPRTGEVYTFKRKGVYKKNGRVLVPVSGNHKDSPYDNSQSDEDAGYPPNCNEGYIEKDGKCIPIKGDNL